MATSELFDSFALCISVVTNAFLFPIQSDTCSCLMICFPVATPTGFRGGPQGGMWEDITLDPSQYCSNML